MQVTGAGHGIGRHLAYRLAGLGARVICLDLDEASNKETVSSITATGGEVSSTREQHSSFYSSY